MDFVFLYILQSGKKELVTLGEEIGFYRGVSACDGSAIR